MMPRAFLSYSRDDVSKVEGLETSLKRVGVRPWRDVSDLEAGRPTEAEIRRAIQEDCDGALLWLSPSTVDSDFVMKIELPIILSEASQTPFHIVPVFDGWPPSDAAARVRERTGLEVASYNGHVLAQGEQLEVEAAEIA